MPLITQWLHGASGLSHAFDCYQDTRDLPDVPGLYLFLRVPRNALALVDLIYLGKHERSIRDRVRNHERLEDAKRLRANYVGAIVGIPVAKLQETETDLLRANPTKLNYQHNALAGVR